MVLAQSLESDSWGEGREFVMTESDFQFIAITADRLSGIQLGPQKKDMVYSRIARRVRALNLKSVTEYCEYLKVHPSEELHFVNSLTTNLTYFFREEHHFIRLAQYVQNWRASGERRLRIWSAGSSTGEEVYSMAMTLSEQGVLNSGKDIKLLATDLDTHVLAHGRRGEYMTDTMRGVSKDRLSKFFSPAPGSEGALIVDESLRRIITFNQLNFLDDKWPMRGPFDVIFCRNVLIYFNREFQAKIITKLAKLLKPGGLLCIGHSENGQNVTPLLEFEHHTTYRRVGP